MVVSRAWRTGRKSHRAECRTSDCVCVCVWNKADKPVRVSFYLSSMLDWFNRNPNPWLTASVQPSSPPGRPAARPDASGLNAGRLSALPSTRHGVGMEAPVIAGVPIKPSSLVESLLSVYYPTNPHYIPLSFHRQWMPIDNISSIDIVTTIYQVMAGIVHFSSIYQWSRHRFLKIQNHKQIFHMHILILSSKKRHTHTHIHTHTHTHTHTQKAEKYQDRNKRKFN